ncbi:glycerol-3-phosphate cytidylyltransferase [Bacillus halotolerans]|jgi:glycerol-3-phosphate cytidylyltransferase|uniref:Glycerol-3-phosphate cytidylyltransferase n=2 Tax=Bacteria TaxID=2 RepID=A0A9Q2LM29_9BACI|nr:MULTISPECIES: glycerol-3-phosphate cytidylyltransferase [Bacillus]BDG81787.1 glycerol-3-phosphate cytidylyltransferase [Bacillus subtilis]KUP35315.1 glycerol-3-phosphate cytidylyltransferase [Bacillus halotolerans]KUP36233.1 glycerol-3-phosphate cytidylyltransferase [Bacillus halotolerans]MBL4978181.1 glycerol-3-phosphate cytidylyltransferase [Bacillus halotolerans]MBT9248728.1 glycerol-3-phosphate cytidylyltransferase [Bacillus halotolerans]
MKKVITYGTFDLLHWGHIKLLERAKQLGDYLVVAISTDEFNLQKQKKAYHSYEHRKLILETIRYVDEVIPEKSWEQKKQDIIDHNIDVFVMGDDWEGKFDFLKDQCEVIYLPRTEGISTTKIKEEIAGI